MTTPLLHCALAMAIGLFPLAARPQHPRRTAAPADARLAAEIRADHMLQQVDAMAKASLKNGMNAGSAYQQTWIRDLNTFIDVALEVNPPSRVRASLLMFFNFQGPDGNIPDGYGLLNPARVQAGTAHTSVLAPNLMSFKNTVEIDQESSLVQAVSKYIAATGDRTILDESIAGVTVRERLAQALSYPLTARFDPSHGLIWGATRADGGDVQPETNPGVLLDASSHRALCIYDNAMLLLAIDDYLQLLGNDAPETAHWTTVRNHLQRNTRKYLWDSQHQKFIPHIYLDGSPFPRDFDENAIDYHGGTAVAIQAGLLTQAEVLAALRHMDADVRASGAASIGLALYPPYPEDFFKNPQMRIPYSYQNGGDWAWVGGRMVQALIAQGYIADAYRELQPLVERVARTGAFHEWWTRDNQPRGSAGFGASAGSLGLDIELLQAWAAPH